MNFNVTSHDDSQMVMELHRIRLESVCLFFLALMLMKNQPPLKFTKYQVLPPTAGTELGLWYVPLRGHNHQVHQVHQPCRDASQDPFPPSTIPRSLIIPSIAPFLLLFHCFSIYTAHIYTRHIPYTTYTAHIAHTTRASPLRWSSPS